MSWDENYKTVMYGFEESIFIARGDELKSAVRKIVCRIL